MSSTDVTRQAVSQGRRGPLSKVGPYGVSREHPLRADDCPLTWTPEVKGGVLAASRPLALHPALAPVLSCPCLWEAGTVHTKDDRPAQQGPGPSAEPQCESTEGGFRGSQLCPSVKFCALGTLDSSYLTGSGPRPHRARGAALLAL